MPKQKNADTLGQCPCGTQRAYLVCCQPLHNGLSKATSAEQLMRSRYSAYVFGQEQYLLSTWHPDTRPSQLNLSQDKAIKWLRLEILNKSNLKLNPKNAIQQATVEFVAFYKIDGKAEKMHENSMFEKLEDNWYYLNGEIRD